jgi:hypothetical protein
MIYLNMTDIIHILDLKTKLESFVKDYIYDGSGDRIKVFGQELPNMTDISLILELKSKLNLLNLLKTISMTVLVIKSNYLVKNYLI